MSDKIPVTLRCLQDDGGVKDIDMEMFVLPRTGDELMLTYTDEESGIDVSCSFIVHRVRFIVTPDVECYEIYLGGHPELDDIKKLTEADAAR